MGLPPPHRVFVQPYTMPRAAREAVAAAVRRAAAERSHTDPDDPDNPAAARLHADSVPGTLSSTATTATGMMDVETNPSSVAPVPTPLPPGWGPSRAVSEGELAPRTTVRELVFFGRLEVRKGIALFCDAVDEMVRSGLLGPNGALGGVSMMNSGSGGVRVTFLGSDRNWVEPGVDGGAYARRRAAAWYWQSGDNGGEVKVKVNGGGGGSRGTPLAAPAEVVTGLDTAGALDYLRSRPGRVAVLPCGGEFPLSILASRRRSTFSCVHGGYT